MNARRNIFSIVLALAGITCASMVFVIQKIEGRGPVIKHVKTTRYFSPDDDDAKDVMFVTFRLREEDHPRLMVIDDDGGVVARARRTKKRDDSRRASFVWNGKASDGRRVKEGAYGLKVRLPKANRTITLPSNVIVDVTPPSLKLEQIDYSRLNTMSIVRITISVERSTEQHVELAGKRLTQVRSVKLGVSDKGRLVSRRISVQVPQFAVSDGKIGKTLRVIAEDRAGNIAMKAVSPNE